MIFQMKLLCHRWHERRLMQVSTPLQAIETQYKLPLFTESSHTRMHKGNSILFRFVELLCFRKWKIENGKWKMILTGNSNHKIFSFSQKILEIPQIVSTICCSILNPSRRDTDILHYTFSIFHYSDLRDRRER